MHNDFEHMMMHRERTRSSGRHHPKRRRRTARRVWYNALRIGWSLVLAAVGRWALTRARRIRRSCSLPA